MGRIGAASIKGVAEYFSFATVVSFAISILANQLVFDRWGLSFLQLATIADVVTSGLSLLMFTLPLALAFLIAWAIGGLTGRLRWVAVVPGLAAALLLAIGALGYAMETPSAGVSAALAMGGVVASGLLMRPGLRLLPTRRKRAFILLAIATAMTVFAIIQFVAYTVSKYEAAGYAAGSPLHLIQSPEEGCDGHVLWTGERALVLDCGVLSSRRDIRVALEPENWVFRAEGGGSSHSSSLDRVR